MDEEGILSPVMNSTIKTVLAEVSCERIKGIAESIIGSAEKKLGATASNGRVGYRGATQSGGAGGGGKGEEVDFDTDTEFDYEKFGRLVTGVGKLVDVLTASGHKDFKALATYIYENDAEKFERAKPVLQDIWNAVARQKELRRVTDEQAAEIFGNISSSKKELNDETRVDPNGRTSSGGDNVDRPNAGVRAVGDRPAGGLLAGGRSRGQDTDERVDSVGRGGIPGRTSGVADKTISKTQSSRADETTKGNVAVGDIERHEMGKPSSRGDRGEDISEEVSPSLKRAAVCRTMKEFESEKGNPDDGTSLKYEVHQC